MSWNPDVFFFENTCACLFEQNELNLIGNLNYEMKIEETTRVIFLNCSIVL